MEDYLDYKEAYFSLMRATEQTIRKLECMQSEIKEIHAALIDAQQFAEEQLLLQGDAIDEVKHRLVLFPKEHHNF